MNDKILIGYRDGYPVYQLPDGSTEVSVPLTGNLFGYTVATPNENDKKIGTSVDGYPVYRTPQGLVYIGDDSSHLPEVELTVYLARTTGGRPIKDVNGNPITGLSKKEMEDKKRRFALDHPFLYKNLISAEWNPAWRSKYGAVEGKDILTMTPYVGDALDVGNIYTDFNKGNYGLAVLGLGFLAIPNFIEKPAKLIGKPLIKGLKVKTPTWLDKKLFPEQSKKLELLLKLRQYMHEHPHDYVTDREVAASIKNAGSDGNYIFRAVRHPSLGYFNRKTTYSGNSQAGGAIENLPLVLKSWEGLQPRPIATWASTKPRYVTNSLDYSKDKGFIGGEIHISPISDFKRIYKMDMNSEYHAPDPFTRIIDYNEINLDHGDHFIYVPKARSWAKMKNGIDYDVSTK